MSAEFRLQMPVDSPREEIARDPFDAAREQINWIRGCGTAAAACIFHFAPLSRETQLLIGGAAIGHILNACADQAMLGLNSRIEQFAGRWIDEGLRFAGIEMQRYGLTGRAVVFASTIVVESVAGLYGGWKLASLLIDYCK